MFKFTDIADMEQIETKEQDLVERILKAPTSLVALVEAANAAPGYAFLTRSAVSQHVEESAQNLRKSQKVAKSSSKSV